MDLIFSYYKRLKDFEIFKIKIKPAMEVKEKIASEPQNKLETNNDSTPWKGIYKI
jgi:hypothetical protein